jgi:hypothetical protein
MTYKVALMSCRLQFTLSFGEHRYGSTQLTITVTEISHGTSITLPLITVHLGCFGENSLRCGLDLYPEYAASNVRVHFLIRCLDQRARDKPEKVKGIEIYNCFEYQAMRLHWNGCGLLLHEFCHLIHQFTLVDSLENATVIKAFESATNSGLYDSVLRYPYE